MNVLFSQYKQVNFIKLRAEVFADAHVTLFTNFEQLRDKSAKCNQRSAF